jgi:LemA protein
MALIIVGSVCGVVLLWCIITYNRFIKGKNMLKEAWSGIDVQLKRRYDLIPNLVETVKGYGKHEKQLFEEIASQRSRCMSAEGPVEKAKAEGLLTDGLKRLIAVAEAYPQLRASENYMELQKSLSEIEDQIQLARRYYNGNARNFNILAEQFPTMIIARLFGYKTAEFFEVETATERQAPQVKF